MLSFGCKAFWFAIKIQDSEFLRALCVSVVKLGLLPVADRGDFLADFRRQLFLDAARAQLGGILNHDGSGRGQGNNQPYQAGEGKAGQGDEFEQVGVIWIVVSDSAESDEKQQRRDAGDHDQSNIDGAMQTLPPAAMRAIQEMLLVVGAHFRSNAGDVVSPSCQDVSDDLIYALCHQKRIASIASVCEASTSRFCTRFRRSPRARSAACRANSG